MPPKSQHRVRFDDRSYFDAGWAYPDNKVLVFIDGMGPKLHGDPKRAQRNKLLRAKARMKGYQVVEITAEGLQDEESLGVLSLLKTSYASRSLMLADGSTRLLGPC